jgi:para-aminobenzoate synthetase component 2
MAQAFGATIRRAPTLVHGEASNVRHDQKGLLAGMPSPFAAARYHSLSVAPDTLPPEFVVTARTVDDYVVMGIRHVSAPVEGVQFHPESVLTPQGPHLLANFLRLCGEGDGILLDGAAGSFALSGFGEGVGADGGLAAASAPVSAPASTSTASTTNSVAATDRVEAVR